MSRGPSTYAELLVLHIYVVLHCRDIAAYPLKSAPFQIQGSFGPHESVPPHSISISPTHL